MIHDSQILVYTAVKGFSYFLIYLASTFGPDGPLSSTDDYRHKNKQRKLQKVKVKDKLEYNLMLILAATPPPPQAPSRRVEKPPLLISPQETSKVG